MSDLEAFRAKAAAWCESMVPAFGKAARKGKVWGCVLCRLLDKIDPGHCEKNIEHDEGERTLE